MRWRCTEKKEFGDEGYNCQFVPVPDKDSGQNVGGSVTISGDGVDAVALVPVQVRTVYAELPVSAAAAPEEPVT